MKKILIVEDEFIEAKNLERMLLKKGYTVCGIARSVPDAGLLIAQAQPDFVLVDIFLKGDLTGIDLARNLRQQNIPFLYLSANSNKSTLDAAKATRPYGFLVKPFGERNVLAMLEIAIYQHENGIESLLSNQQRLIPTQSPAPAKSLRIVGESEDLQQTLNYVRLVAPAETSVLILGESGTGKELIANAIHELSPRNNKPFIKVNCAALPVTLIESILFGHEKGAFTGAIARSIGKFEQAEKGTIFLDEIGEIPPEVQVKLLRVLQEKEIERVGGRETIKVDVRVIAATNRNLEREMAAGRFRIDLYYRLNVFPIYLSPLKDRRKDILLLADHFIDRFCNAMGKPVFEIPRPIVDKLLSYHWPGNIRELENAMQRLVLLYSVQRNDLANSFLILQHPNSDKQPDLLNEPDQEQDIKTWEEYERHYILHVLKKCNGKISGENGAAKILDLPPSTLASKMKRLGIQKDDYTTGK
jgi:DNA-binding NtrC family response regulator